jgi:hypothetical protein
MSANEVEISQQSWSWNQSVFNLFREWYDGFNVIAAKFR